MTTALQIITDALTEVGVVGAGDTVSPEDTDLALRRLNQVLQRWANLRLLSPVLTEISVPMTGAASYTIGPSGVVVAARPIRVESARSVDSAGTEYACNIYSAALWDEIPVKAVTGGPPSVVYYSATNTNGTLYVYPRPSSGYTVKLRVLSLLETYTVNEVLALPEGYESAFTLTLADDLFNAYGKPSSADVRRRATAAVRALKRANSEPLLMSIDTGGLGVFEMARGY